MNTNFSFAKKITFFLSTALFFFFVSCGTTKQIQIFDDYQTKTQPSAPDAELYKADEEDKYIFIRLYDPVYTSPLEVTNLLKVGLYLTNTSKDIVSHAAINFDLNDDFYGLTVGNKQQLKIETCTDTSKNVFMKKASMKHSTQYVYALKVSNEEYKETKEMVEYIFKHKNLKYSVGWNFPSAMYSIYRKFFVSKKNRGLGNKRLTKKSYKIEKDYNPAEIPSKYVCSSFIAFVLLQNVDQVHQFFQEKNINYRYVSPGDYEEFPGIIKLFYSTWEDYDLAAEQFVQQNPDFAVYYTIKEKSDEEESE